eukprot:10725503-Heterocapsa_arctica.AAC.1
MGATGSATALRRASTHRRFSQPFRKRTCPGCPRPANLEVGGMERGRHRNPVAPGQEVDPDHPEPCGGMERREGTLKPHPQPAIAGWKH